MWEFDPVGTWTLQRFFGTMHEDIWKLIFKAQKSWPETIEDRGLDCARPATPVSFMITFICKSKEYIELSYSTGLDKEGGADQMSGSASRRPDHPFADEDAGSGAISGTGEEGQEEGPGGKKRPPS